MPRKTLPSARTYVIDMPEIENFSANFIYNFFEPDERINDSGKTTPEFIRKRPTTNFDSELISPKELDRNIPRYVRFSWKPVLDQEQKTINNNITIKENLEKVHEEQDFLARNFSAVEFGHNNRNQYVDFLIEQLKEEQGVLKEQEEIKLSSMDIAKFLKGNINQAIDDQLISDIISYKEKNGQFFFGNIGKIDEETLLKNISNVKTSMAINKKFIKDVLQTTLETGHNLFQDQTDELFQTAEEIQDEQQRTVPSNVINAEDYDFEIVEFVDYKPIDPSGYSPQKQFMGYIIDKYELDEEGNRIPKDSIVIESPLTNTTVDFQIKYGTRYVYTIKSVLLLESLVEDISEENGQFVLLQYLVASKPSNEVHINCIENTPPPPPSDFNVRWDANKQKLVLYWNFPVNTQRDIKKWQIFRRESIYEPYELQQVYDFNDSVVIDEDEFREYPDGLLVQKLKSPANYYIDKGFEPNRTYIYTVCAIDAHGLTSNYSTQFACQFSTERNKLIKNLVSISGAPKSYPNMLLESDLLVDTIKSSGASKMKVLFTPEYLKLLDSNNNDLGLIKTQKNTNSYYKINLINVDLQEQQDIEIRISDRRKSNEPETQEPSKLSKPLRFGLRRRF